MKILIINDFLTNVGGAETFIYTLKSVLEKRGHVIRLLGSNGVEDISTYFSRWYSRKWYKKTVENIENFRPDIVHVNNCVRIISPSVIRATLKMKVPLITTIHDFHYICPKAWGIRPNGLPCQKWFGLRCIPGNCKGPQKRWTYYPVYLMKLLRVAFHRRMLKDVRNNLFAPSQILADSMKKSLGVNIGVINNGVNIPNKETKYEKVILYNGILNRRKGFHTVAIKLNDVENYSVLVLGNGSKLENYRSKYKNIRFYGFQDPTSFYEKASIGVVPSIWMENFPFTVIEAMSYGICVVASRRGGIPEQIKHMETGLLFEAANEADFEKQLNYLFQNPEEIKRLGMNAREYIKEKFDWKIIVKKYENVYENLTH